MCPEERRIFEMWHQSTKSAARGNSVPEASAVLSWTAYLQHISRAA